MAQMVNHYMNKKHTSAIHAVKIARNQWGHGEYDISRIAYCRQRNGIILFRLKCAWEEKKIYTDDSAERYP